MPATALTKLGIFTFKLLDVPVGSLKASFSFTRTTASTPALFTREIAAVEFTEAKDELYEILVFTGVIGNAVTISFAKELKTLTVLFILSIMFKISPNVEIVSFGDIIPVPTADFPPLTVKTPTPIGELL